MVMKIILFFFFLYLVACAHHGTKTVTIDQSLGRWQTDPVPQNLKVILVPQWHLSANQNTRNASIAIPQKENQLAIYQQLLLWQKQDSDLHFVFEGCSGKLSEQSELKFNGWSLNDLKQEVQNKKNPTVIEPILTHMGLKLLAEFPAEKNVFCGDDLEKIDQHQLVLSDLRGLIGFKVRIQDSQKQKKSYNQYIEGVREVLKLPKGESEVLTLKSLDEEILKSLEKFDQLTRDRNLSFLKQIEKADRDLSVVIIGALHIEDLKKSLNEKHIHYAVWQPKGLESSSDTLLKELRQKLGL